jgi:hypothetical protein
MLSAPDAEALPADSTVDRILTGQDSDRAALEARREVA